MMTQFLMHLLTSPQYVNQQTIQFPAHHCHHLTLVVGKFEVKRNFDPLLTKLATTLSMSPVFKCCGVVVISIRMIVILSKWAPEECVVIG